MTVKVGYEIKTGELVEIPHTHLIVTGLTQESGKTTTLDALIKRSPKEFKAIIFRTKPGEKSVLSGQFIPPFYTSEWGWEYAVELLEATVNEKLKFHRSWIIHYAKMSKNIEDFKRIIDNALADKKGKLKSIDRSVLTELQAYIEKVIPELRRIKFSNRLELHPGINVMDVETFSDETQMLIVRSVLNEVLKGGWSNTIIIVPECWKFIPEGRRTPVKRAASAFIRQGAVNENYLWLDSQDITGVSKTELKQVSTWILGYQRETNEIKRTLEQINCPKKSKPKPDEIATLEVGHFFVTTAKFVKKVYVQPSWMVSDDAAKQVALGKVDVRTLIPPEVDEVMAIDGQVAQVIKKGMRYVELEKEEEIDMIDEDARKDILFLKGEMKKLYEAFTSINVRHTALLQTMRTPGGGDRAKPVINEDAIVEKVLARMSPFDSGKPILVSPLEKIKEDFMLAAKEHVLEKIRTLDDNQKGVLKFVEAQGNGCSLSAIIDKGLFLSATSGGTRDKISKKTIEMNTLGVIRRDKNATCYPNLKALISSYMGAHGASEDKVEQVYNHIMHEMI